MAIRIELWIDGRLARGTEVWWDDAQAALPDDRNSRYPLLSRVDPYDDVIFSRDELELLHLELENLAAGSSDGLGVQMAELMRLCVAGFAARDAQLRFLGD